MIMEQTALADALFRPRGIALVGASDDRNKHSSLPHQYLRRHGYPGEIFPINPNRDTVLGERAYRSVADIGRPVDHAFIMLPTRGVQQAVEDCCSAGVRCATILSDGFAEKGVEGRAAQERLVDFANRHGLRLLGPNSLGLINVGDRVALSANEILSTPQLRQGRLALISQSGSLIGALLSRGEARGIGFSKMISVGNEADLGVAELGDMLAADPDSDAILLFLETIRNADALTRMVQNAFAAGKPVIAFRVGRSDIGQELAASHTGALAGSGPALDAFLKHIGVISVETVDGLLEAAPLFRGKKPPSDRRVNIVSTTGGGGALVVDTLSRHDIDIVPPTAETIDRLHADNIRIAAKPLVDLTLAGTNPSTYGSVLSGLLASGDSSLVIAVVGSSSQFRPDRAVAPIISSTAAYPHKPVAVFLTPHAEKSLDLLADAGIAAFRSPESCADGVRAFLDWRAPKTIDAGPVPPQAAALMDANPGDMLDAAVAAGLYRSLGVPMASEVVLPVDVDAWNGREETVSFPAVAKILSPDIAHKTEVNGVAIGVSSMDELKAACSEIVRSVRAAMPHAALTGLQIQPMVKGISEALLGFRRDPAVGPIVTLAAGGVLTEIYRDAAVRMAPIDKVAALEMIEEVRGLAPIRGYRGLQKGDLDALANAIEAFSRLALLAVEEAEINPLLIQAEGEGVIGVDAVVMRKARHAN